MFERVNHSAHLCFGQRAWRAKHTGQKRGDTRRGHPTGIGADLVRVCRMEIASATAMRMYINETGHDDHIGGINRLIGRIERHSGGCNARAVKTEVAGREIATRIHQPGAMQRTSHERTPTYYRSVTAS